MAVSIEDFARRTGMSIGTASHMINGGVAARVARSIVTSLIAIHSEAAASTPSNTEPKR